MVAKEFAITDAAEGGAHTLALIGEVDLATAPQLQDAIARLCAAGASQIVLDLRELTFMDSTGVHALLASKALCDRHGCDFSLTRGQESVERLFELTGLREILPFRDARSGAGPSRNGDGPGDSTSP